MRIKLTCFLLLILAITGCKKENDRAFDKSPDERANELLDQYQTQLEGGVNGWMGYLTTKEGTNYTFYFRFNDQNRVVMYSDFTSESARVGAESSYRLKALQQVSLLFDTYSYIHVLADPDPEVAGGAVGAGFGVDFEFYFDNASNDTINLVGRKHTNNLKLVRATAEQEAYLSDGKWGATVFTPNIDNILYYWKVVTIGGVSYQILVDTDGRNITLQWKDASGNPQSFTTPYHEVLGGIVFDNTFHAAAGDITGFSNITWNSASSSFSLEAGGQSTTLAGSNIPVYVDANAPADFRQASTDIDGYWATYDGFHINGIDGAFPITGLTGNATYPYYRYFIFWPDYSPGIDLLAPIFRSSTGSLGLIYGAGMVASQPSTPGAIRFTYTYIFGSGAPTSGAYIQTLSQANSSSGYYFVKITDGVYDMVSVSDARRWVTWILV